ncbi:MAG: hypothetical protein WCB67_15720 [Solirubrobacteraceae bacterium]
MASQFGAIWPMPGNRMKRLAGYLSLLLCAAAVPSTALAAQPRAVQGTVTGTISYVGGSVLTIQTGGRAMGIISAMSRTASALTAHNYPYVYGGGHAEAGIASIGIRGPGYNGRRIGYDCSGSVASVLAGAGLWPAGSGVPNDAGLIQQLLQDKLIARGPGTAPNEVTFYDHPGVHIFMNINGRFFGTSDGGGGNSKGGPAWLYDGAPASHDPVFKRFHLLPSVLRKRTTYGESYTFQTDSHPILTEGAESGEKVRIAYTGTQTGSMTATSIQYLGAVTASGTVTALASDGSSMSVQTSAGQVLMFSTSAIPDVIAPLQVGDGVQVTYSKDPAGLLVPHAVQTLSTPAPTAPSTSQPVPPVPTTSAR